MRNGTAGPLFFRYSGAFLIGGIVLGLIQVAKSHEGVSPWLVGISIACGAISLACGFIAVMLQRRAKRRKQAGGK